ncbi:MAG: hypothetical protein KKC18_04120 [Chloroflexi bacterium]|nr:hypothetical protein [Chloroflexota bacterium]
MSLCGQAGLRIETVGAGAVWEEREAEQVYESGMLDQIVAQVGHMNQMLVELEEVGGSEGGIGNGGLAPVAL